MKERICFNCKKVYFSSPSGKLKFCSKECYHKDMTKRRGECTPRWRGGFPLCLICGKQLSVRKIEYCRNHSVHKGNNHYQWRGEDVSYNSLHSWIRRELGSADHCEHCGLKEIPEGKKRFFDWANISHQYNRDTQDYFQLCKICHKKYDRKEGD